MRKVFVLVLVSLVVMLTMPLIFTNVAEGAPWAHGCCQYPSGCISGYLDVGGCYAAGGDFYQWRKCCDGKCYLCCTDADCQEGYICNPETHECEEEVPEFPAGVTAVFGATLFIFLMMRRKYIRK